MLRFTTDTRIWPTNISERGLRPTKTQQKIVRHEALCSGWRCEAFERPAVAAEG